MLIQFFQTCLRLLQALPKCAEPHQVGVLIKGIPSSFVMFLQDLGIPLQLGIVKGH
jgi:hypothetical protein